MNRQPPFTGRDWAVAAGLGVKVEQLGDKLRTLKQGMSYDDLIAHIQRKAKVQVGRTWMHYRIHDNRPRRPEG